MEITKKFVKAIKKNDRKKILSLYNFTFNKLMSITVRFFVNEEDRITIVNNTFIKIINNIDKFKIGSSYFSWVSRIAHNEIIDTYRKNKKHKALFSNNEFDENLPYIDENEETDGEYTEQELLDLINQLPNASKIVFNMYVVEGGYTYKDIAEVLNVSVETVKWHLKSARKQLKLMIVNSEVKQ